MAGVTKHIFEHDIRDILCMLDTQLKCISKVLPKEYSHEDILDSLKLYYPHEWFSVEMKYLYYTQKDKCLKNRFGKARYNMLPAEELLRQTKQYQFLMSTDSKKRHTNCFSEELFIKESQALWRKRAPKIQAINAKIDRAKSKVQQVTPAFIDQLIGLYERKNTRQKDRVYILAELKKYYSPKIIQFFYKLNDTELNKQLRWEAFYHLQSFGYRPRARRQKYMQVHTENKKRKKYLKNVYPNETYSIIQTPDELEYRINNSKEQKLKKYDFFISHSYKDSALVQKLIEHENLSGNDVFCDWINDSDYLKRHLLCSATLSVIEKRLEQSDALLFLHSENSVSSVWCKYELNYFHALGRPIYTISADDVENSVYSAQLEKDCWFLDENYKNLVRIEASKVLDREAGAI